MLRKLFIPGMIVFAATVLVAQTSQSVADRIPKGKFVTNWSCCHTMVCSTT